MAYTIVPHDLLILYGLLALFFYDPLSPPRDRMETHYQSLKRRIPGAVQNAAVFGIAWSLLYTCMAVSVFMLYLERADLYTWVAYANFALTGAILLTTKAWTPLFFASPRVLAPATAHGLALLDWLALLVCVICYIVFAALGDPAYAAGCIVPPILMAPTLLWLLYAGYLNAAALALDWRLF